VKPLAASHCSIRTQASGQPQPLNIIMDSRPRLRLRFQPLIITISSTAQVLRTLHATNLPL
jgi:hypothetical protein